MIRYALTIVAITAACRGTGSPSAGPDDAPDGAVAAANCPAPLPPVVLPCDEPEPEAITTTGDDKLTLTRAKFADLPGWADDSHAAAVPAFLASCEKLAALDGATRIGAGPYAGRVRDWRGACAAAARVPSGDNAAARAFFEKELTPYAAHGSKGPEGKMTGYYVQALNGSRKRGGANQFPIFSRPSDLVSIQLSEFIDDGRSRRVWGRVDKSRGTVVSYPIRADIPRDEEHVLLWVDDPVDAIAVEIEGSGKVTLDDGSVVWIAFAGKNGRRARRLRGVVQAMRELKETMKGDRASLDAYLQRYHEIADLKQSIVFFEIEARAGAIGTQDVVLTPRRSLAVDRAVIALSTPIWVDTRAPTSGTGRFAPWRHLLIAQDTGGNILGSIRGDIYWGDDREAAAIGGRVNQPGRMWLLLPRRLRVPTK